MILRLVNQKIKILPMRVPEPLNHTFLKYQYEFNTEHLTPKLTVGNKVYSGEDIYIDLDLVKGDEVEVRVDLLNSLGVITKTYRGKIPVYRYILLGKKPVRIDIDEYVKELEAKVVELQNEGEVI